MTTYLGKSCSFCLPRVPFVNCRQFMYLVISLLVLRAGYGIWLYQFLIIAYLFTFRQFWACRESCVVQKTPILWVLRPLPHTCPQDWSLVVPKPVRRLHGPALHPKGHIPNLWGTRTSSCYTASWAKHRTNTQRIGRTHVTIASQEGDFVRTSHGPQTSMAPKVYRVGTHPWVSCKHSDSLRVP